jgi:hypothetical protein
MSQFQAASPAGGARRAPTCPTCQGPLTAKLICWRCCDRLCGACGRPTGSAFIELCWPCAFRDGGGEAPPGRVRAGPGPIRY